MDSNEQSGNEWDEAEEDQYRDSDTSENLPDPNDLAAPLYQDVNKLPVDLKRIHFEEGLVYSMTLKTYKKHPMLVMIIEAGDDFFVFRPFFVRASSKKTFHEGLADQKCEYQVVQRLAPRRELTRERKPEDARIGETIRFTYGMSEKYITGFILRATSRKVECMLECGADRGQHREFDIYETVG